MIQILKGGQGVKIGRFCVVCLKGVAFYWICKSGELRHLISIRWGSIGGGL